MRMFRILVLSAVVLFSANMAALASVRSTQNYANRVTPLNKVTDYFATLGKPPMQKNMIKNARKAARRRARLQKMQEYYQNKANR